MKLDVWMDNVEDPVGVLDRADDKTMRFTYAVGVPAEGRISMSLPLGEQVFSDAACVAYFGNLLFEGQELDRVMALHRIDRDDIAGLLYHLGADCPGAISITPDLASAPACFRTTTRNSTNSALKRSFGPCT